MEETTSDDLPPHSSLSDGCKLCYQGGKMVLFITGICKRTCWYCPLSRERKGHDDIYANEHKISSISEMISVAERMSALGTGVTGGEPFAVIDRLVEYTTALKQKFGKEHQIHLYTGIAPTRDQLSKISGLVDEIRLHPPHEVWPEIMDSSFPSSIKTAKELGFIVGVEVPSLIGIEDLKPLLEDLDFFNINELEWGDSNADEMRKRGYEFRGDVSNAVAGGYSAVEKFAVLPKVHWCSSDFKDRVQLRRRLIRIANNTARPFEEVTEDGTIVYGVFYCKGMDEELPDDIPADMYARFEDRIEMAWWILDELSECLTGKKEILERYPDNGIIIEVTPC